LSLDSGPTHFGMSLPPRIRQLLDEAQKAHGTGDLSRVAYSLHQPRREKWDGQSWRYRAEQKQQCPPFGQQHGWAEQTTCSPASITTTRKAALNRQLVLRISDIPRERLEYQTWNSAGQTTTPRLEFPTPRLSSILLLVPVSRTCESHQDASA
jgi:hypothetical protein